MKVRTTITQTIVRANGRESVVTENYFHTDGDNPAFEPSVRNQALMDAAVAYTRTHLEDKK